MLGKRVLIDPALETVAGQLGFDSDMHSRPDNPEYHPTLRQARSGTRELRGDPGRTAFRDVAARSCRPPPTFCRSLLMIFAALVCVAAATAISAPAAPLVPKAAPAPLDIARPTELVRDGCGYGYYRTRRQDGWGYWLGPLRSEVVGERCVSAAG
jgi:hypothetical protein